MRIGIASPVLIEPFRKHLDMTQPVDISEVKGLGVTMTNIIARRLLDLGHQVVLFTLEAGGKSEVVLDGPLLRICIGPYRSSRRRRAFDFYQVEREYIQRAIEREKPDIVHAHWTYEFALGALASSVPTLVTVRDWAPAYLAQCRNLNQAIYFFIRYLMDRQTFKRAEWISANSPLIQERIRKRWGRHVPVIPNTIEDSRLRVDEKPFPSGAPCIISVNNGFSLRKNTKTLLRAFSLIRRRVPECKLLFVGYQFEPGGIAEQWASESNLNEGVEYFGHLAQEKIIGLLDKASLMIHPSIEESFGNTLVEAMARRVPVLGGEKSGAVPWVLDNGRAGALCDVRNPESITREAVEILTSRERWTKLSEAGYARVRGTFSLSRVVDTCLAEYRRVVEDNY